MKNISFFAVLIFISWQVLAGDLKLAFLHMNPVVADMQANTEWIEKAMAKAAEHDVDWVLTPELALTGYYFEKQIGSEWIKTDDPYLMQLQKAAAEHQQVLFLSHVSKNAESGKRHNTLYVIDRKGKVLGQHHKINTIPQSEDWSSKGEGATVVAVDGLNVGLLICADMWTADHTASAKQQGAELIISSANWGPGEYGPKDIWEKRSAENQIPVLVNNRTGMEGTFDLREAVSVISHQGQRVFEFQNGKPHLIVIGWDREKQQFQQLVSTALER